jgi:hypothetical protein
MQDALAKENEKAEKMQQFLDKEREKVKDSRSKE